MIRQINTERLHMNNPYTSQTKSHGPVPLIDTHASHLSTRQPSIKLIGKQCRRSGVMTPPGHCSTTTGADEPKIYCKVNHAVRVQALESPT